jgi:hypothetical protein
MLINHALGLWLATLVIEGRVVKIAIKADVKWTVAFGADLAKTDPLPEFNLPPAMKTVHQFMPAKWSFPLA